MEAVDYINHFLVKTFRSILSQEELALSGQCYQDLSVTEFHVIEAVCEAGVQNSMSALSQALGITTGSLTVAVKTLEKKGYLQRTRSYLDRRRVDVLPTDQGLEANAHHEHFHQQMIEAISQLLDPQQMEVLASAVRALTKFFTGTEHKLTPDVND